MKYEWKPGHFIDDDPPFVYIRPSIYCLKRVKLRFYQRYNAGLIPHGYRGWGVDKVCPKITVLVSELPEIFDWLASQPLSEHQANELKRRTASSIG